AAPAAVAVTPTLLLGSLLCGRVARPCLLRRRLGMEALGKHLLACRAVPLLVLVVGDLALDKQLCEFSALRLALERHQAEASKRQICTGADASKVFGGFSSWSDCVLSKSPTPQSSSLRRRSRQSPHSSSVGTQISVCRSDEEAIPSSLGGQAGADPNDPGRTPAHGWSDRAHCRRTAARAGDGRLDWQGPARPHRLVARPLRARDRGPPSGPPTVRRDRSRELHRRV